MTYVDAQVRSSRFKSPFETIEPFEKHILDPFHKGLRLIASLLNTRFVIELRND